jgi:hypothetical protein
VLGPGVPQIHDYNPGIAQSGLFWTVRMPGKAVHIDRRTGAATYAMNNMRLEDYYNLVNAFAGGPSTPSVASFLTTFTPKGKVISDRNEANSFAVRYRVADARLAWTSQGGGFSFRSDKIGTSASTFAMIGTERNGKFFR